MLKKIALFHGLIFCLLSYVVEAGTPSTPAFWKVSKGGASVYLLGSMHFGRKDFYPLPNVIEKAYTDSDRLVVEVDILSVQPAAAMQAIYKYGAMPIGQTLKTRLSSKLYEALEQQCKANGLPVSAFESFQPWFVAMQLVEAEIKKTPLKQELGVDLYFLSKGNKPVDQLESIESQMGLFSQFSIDEQALFLDQTLKDFQNSQKYLEDMAEGWRNGDVILLEQKILKPFRESINTKKLFDALFTLRNLKMADAVDQYLKNAQNVFFIVGAGHMIGEDGIVSRLKRKGYAVNRVQFLDN